jgi:hypothetical protein
VIWVGGKRRQCSVICLGGGEKTGIERESRVGNCRTVQISGTW